MVWVKTSFWPLNLYNNIPGCVNYVIYKCLIFLIELSQVHLITVDSASLKIVHIICFITN